MELIFLFKINICLPVYLITSVVSNSLKPHRLSPSRLHCPWNSPGKNTGVHSHSLLQGNLPDPGIEPASPALYADSLPSEPPGKPK